MDQSQLTVSYVTFSINNINLVSMLQFSFLQHQINSNIFSLVL